jgi:hypothetical protein
MDPSVIVLYIACALMLVLKDTEISAQKKTIDNLSAKVAELTQNNDSLWFNSLTDSDFTFLFLTFLMILILLFSLYCAYNIGFSRGIRFSSTKSNIVTKDSNINEIK